jgi:hypothetical protein
MKLTRATVVAVNQVINGVPVTTVRLPGSKVAVPVEVTVGTGLIPGDVVEVATSNGRVIILSKTSSETVPPAKAGIGTLTSDAAEGFSPYPNGLFGGGDVHVDVDPNDASKANLAVQNPSGIWGFSANPSTTNVNNGFSFPFNATPFQVDSSTTPPTWSQFPGIVSIPMHNYPGPFSVQSLEWGSGAITWFTPGGGLIMSLPTIMQIPTITPDVGDFDWSGDVMLWACTLDYAQVGVWLGHFTVHYHNGISTGTIPFQMLNTDFKLFSHIGADLSLVAFQGIESAGGAGPYLAGCAISINTPSVDGSNLPNTAWPLVSPRQP